MEEMTCPLCGGKRVLPIYRGYLPFDLARAVQEKRAVYEGCVLNDDAAYSWFCSDCGNRW